MSAPEYKAATLLVAAFFLHAGIIYQRAVEDASSRPANRHGTIFTAGAGTYMAELRKQWRTLLRCQLMSMSSAHHPSFSCDSRPSKSQVNNNSSVPVLSRAHFLVRSKLNMAVINEKHIALVVGIILGEQADASGHAFERKRHLQKLRCFNWATARFMRKYAFAKRREFSGMAAHADILDTRFPKAHSPRLANSLDHWRGEKLENDIRRPEARSGAFTDGCAVNAENVGRGKNSSTTIGCLWFVLRRF
jgi:hypothetical protein